MTDTTDTTIPAPEPYQPAPPVQVQQQPPKPPRPYHVVAHPGRRLAARMIDNALLGVAAGILTLLVIIGNGAGEEPSAGPYLFVMLFIVALAVAYEVCSIAQFGQTIGKRLMGIAVVRTEDTRYPTGWSSFLRFLVPNVASVIPFGGTVIYASILWANPQGGQGWHDQAAGTRVVNSIYHPMFKGL